MTTPLEGFTDKSPRYPDVLPSDAVTIGSHDDWPQCAQCNRRQQTLGYFWPDLCHMCINSNLRNHKHVSDDAWSPGL